MTIAADWCYDSMIIGEKKRLYLPTSDQANRDKFIILQLGELKTNYTIFFKLWITDSSRIWSARRENKMNLQFNWKKFLGSGLGKRSSLHVQMSQCIEGLGWRPRKTNSLNLQERLIEEEKYTEKELWIQQRCSLALWLAEPSTLLVGT